ncbi:MAG: hypothetical protein C4320_07290, partial [Armatimonadota bacterium]
MILTPLLGLADPAAGFERPLAAYSEASKRINEQRAAAEVDATPYWDAAKGEWAIQRKEGWFRLDPKTNTLVARDAFVTPPPRGRSRRAPGRGRQFSEVIAPDGKTKAIARDRNVILITEDGKERPITTDGSAGTRIKYGTASWVYGEELEQNEAMWFSPDGKLLAYYRFDESQVPDYFVLKSVGAVQNRSEAEAYPKAGAPNPQVSLRVTNLASGKTTSVDVKFGNPALAEYVYGIRWIDATTLLYSRMDRAQETMQVVRADAVTGAGRVLRQETAPGGWVESAPVSSFDANGDVLQPLPTGEALWITETSGYRNLVAFDLEGKRPARVLTQHPFDVAGIVRVDPARKEIWYEARSGRGPYLVQLHRVGFDGKGDVRLTDPAFAHRVRISDDGASFMDTATAWDVPPTLTLRDRQGKALFLIGKAAPYQGFAPIRRIKCLAADGKTTIAGWVKTPEGAGPWPAILDVYGGPGFGTNRERYEAPDARTGAGLAVAWVDARGSGGQGRAFRQAVVRKLGGPEIDDMAAFARALVSQGIAAPGRIGIAGTSYGGYASAMAILRFP